MYFLLVDNYFKGVDLCLLFSCLDLICSCGLVFSFSFKLFQFGEISFAIRPIQLSFIQFVYFISFVCNLGLFLLATDILR